MSRVSRRAVAFYGVAFHAIVVVVLAAVAAGKAVPVPRGLYGAAVGPVLIASFAVYYWVVGRYVARRRHSRGAVFTDSAVGMFAECMIVPLAAALYGIVVATTLSTADFFGAAVHNALASLLYVFGTFFVQLLAIGNAAGLIGWVVLKRLEERTGRR